MTYGGPSWSASLLLGFCWLLLAAAGTYWQTLIPAHLASLQTTGRSLGLANKSVVLYESIKIGKKWRFSFSGLGFPVYQILEARGLEVCLVNAQHVKNVPGGKTDVSDCKWLQYLHAVGLLRASFRPPAEICAIRSLWRHRNSLIQMAAEHGLHMQKALDQMNLQIHRVLNDITGVSGLKILDAILAGQRDSLALARLCHGGVKSNEDAIAKSLEGDYRREHLFALRQSLTAFRYYQQLVVEVDKEIELHMSKLQTAVTAEKTPPARTKARHYQK